MIIQPVSEHLAKHEERVELEAVENALGQNSRLAHLLRYLCEKCLNGEDDQLTEFNIATEVLGRSKTVFDPGEDSIVRVEAHRLRKRLKEFYEGAAKDHPVHISIPLGTYVPSFTRPASETLTPGSSPPGIPGHVAGISSPAGAAIGQQRRREPGSSAAFLWLRRPRNWFALLAVVLLGSGAIFYTISRLHPRAQIASRAGSPAAIAAPPTGLVGVPAPAAVPLRLLAGYSGPPETDSANEVWNADRYFHGGGPWRRSDASVARTSDFLLFEHWRSGDFSYDIPLQPGVYELHLYFVASEASSDSLRSFAVRINGALVLSGFDINSDAMGENIADERIFRDVSPAADGMLHVSFANERVAPQINALEVLPGIPHKQLPIRLIMQSTPYTDHNGQSWHPDDYFLNGWLSDQREEIPGSSDPDLFSTERYGHFSYAIPVDTRDRYTLILHFVERYFGEQNGGGAGSRVFRVMCNGEVLLDNFDIYKEAGSLHVLTKTFYHLKPSAQGKLNLTFEPIRNSATVSGIEVLDESQ